LPPNRFFKNATSVFFLAGEFVGFELVFASGFFFGAFQVPQVHASVPASFHSEKAEYLGANAVRPGEKAAVAVEKTVLDGAVGFGRKVEEQFSKRIADDEAFREALEAFAPLD
jgi:hypothetical protein